MTPRVVRFSQIHHPLSEILYALRTSVFRRLRVRLNEFAPLRLSYDESDGGLELDGDLIPCDDESKALQLATGADSFGLSYVAASVPANFNLYFFDITPHSFATTATLEPSMISYERDDLAMGEWLFRLLLGITHTLRCDVVGYGPDAAYGLKHEPLAPDPFVARLRRGELFAIPGPSFQAVSTRLIGITEMQHLLRAYPRSEEPTYSGNPLRPYVLSGDYHVLSRLPY